jgi:hypothetical protein
MRPFVLGVAIIGAASAQAQSLAKRVTQSDGTVQVVYPSRPGACGDGATYITNVLGDDRYFANGNITSGRGYWREAPCVAGPARVAATVMDGEVTRLRAYVGPVPQSDARTITAGVGDVRAWLEQLITTGSGRVAQQAALPLILADSTDPWPTLLGVARNDQRPLAVRREALGWVARGVNHHLGLQDAIPETDDDEMKKQAVFILSQRVKRDGSAELMDLARNAKRPIVRRDAIFWLGQTGDPREVADLFANLLK